MTEEEKLAYLAGIIDGEGSIMIYCSRGMYSLIVNIYNSNKDLMIWLESEFGGSCGETHRKRNKEEKWLPEYRWSIMGKNAYNLLMRLDNKMIIKTEQKNLGIKFYEECVNKTIYRGNRPRPNWLRKRQGEYCQAMHTLNARGRKKEGITNEPWRRPLHEQQQLPHQSKVCFCT